MRTLFPGVRLGYCLRHAINKLPGKLAAITSPVRKALRTQFHTLLYRARQRKGLRGLPWVSACATSLTTSPPRLGRPMASGGGVGFRTRKLTGMRCLKIPGCR